MSRMNSTPANQLDDKHREPSLRALALLGLGLFVVGATLPIFLGPYFSFSLVRWLALTVIAAGGLRKSSLTYWIFFAMLAGGEIGFDWPRVASNRASLTEFFFRSIP